MSEPSKEAWALAEDLWDQRGDPAEIAAALQKLMDERVEAEDHLLAQYKLLQERTEAAEKNLTAFRHDKDVIVSQLEKRAETAEAETAELCKAMREWWDGKVTGTVLSRDDKILFHAILNNYER